MIGALVYLALFVSVAISYKVGWIDIPGEVVLGSVLPLPQQEEGQGVSEVLH